MKHKLLVYAAIFIAIMTACPVSAIPQRPEPQRLVNDFAGIFTSSQIRTLENTLVEFDDTTSNQIAVITTLDLEGYAIAEYATRIGIGWQVGSEKFDNGVVIVVKPKTSRSDGEVFIATGYGLEGAIPDVYAKRIIDRVMIPYFINGDYYGGVSAACDTIMKLASGEISEPREEEEDPLWVFIAFLLIIIIIIILVGIASGNNNGGNGSGGRGPTIYTGPIITGGRNSGGFSGGSFGGGFGGFGGGSFGGGGAGGRW